MAGRPLAQSLPLGGPSIELRARAARRALRRCRGREALQGARVCVFDQLPRRIGAAAKKSARRSSTLTEH